MEQEDLQKMQELQQIEAMKRQVISALLSKEAFERLGRIRAANPAMASQVEMYLIQVAQTGKIRGKISDEQFKEMLKSLTNTKETKIRRV